MIGNERLPVTLGSKSMCGYFLEGLVDPEQRVWFRRSAFSWEAAGLCCDGCDGVVGVWAQDDDDERTLEEEERVAEEEGDGNANEVSDVWCVGL